MLDEPPVTVMTRTPSIALHAYQPRTRANGPGVRFAVWFQGCSLGCPGCFNPDTHEVDGREPRTVSSLVAEILAQGSAIEGVTMSGGEPLQQPEAALELARAIRQAGDLSILVFSGYTVEEIRGQPLGPEFLASIDVLIDGRYDSHQRLARRLRGSENQRVHLLTGRYTLADIERTPEAEIIIDARGNITLSGVAPISLRKR